MKKTFYNTICEEWTQNKESEKTIYRVSHKSLDKNALRK